MRRFVIGDIHGCAKALRSLIETIQPQIDDEIILLGDYIDRGPDSRNVIQQILELRQRCHVVALRGNHEIMLLGVTLGGLDDTVWLENGGNATVTSYGGSLAKIPAEHLDFFQKLEPYHETGDSIFVHAGYHPQRDMHAQDSATIYWNHLPYPLPAPHKSGKRVIVGHTPQPSGQILNGGHVICVDTYCFGGGYLTAMDTDTCEVIQANLHGHVRRVPIQIMARKIARLFHVITGRAISGRDRPPSTSRASANEDLADQPSPSILRSEVDHATVTGVVRGDTAGS
jgi:serine/threonine protein phosphatase 1